MQLKHPLEHYFKYHPATTPERIDLHRRANALAFEACSIMINDSNASEVDFAVRTVLDTIPKLTIDVPCRTWANCAVRDAGKQALVDNHEAVLMHMQQCRMFLNQGITMDSLPAPAS
jgi:hypothetical protein